MAEQVTSELAGLLRQLRAGAGLTQQELAKAAGMSRRSVSDLERAINRTARHDTAVRLAGALGLAEPARSLFVAAARGRIQVGQVLAARRGQAPGEPPASAGGVHGFVPALTSFVGRAGPVREVAALLDRNRLVTVTGPGGAGKTRLAGQVAGQVAAQFADGVWLAELAPVRDPALVPAVVMTVLGVRDQPGLPAAGVLARVLARPGPRSWSARARTRAPPRPRRAARPAAASARPPAPVRPGCGQGPPRRTATGPGRPGPARRPAAPRCPGGPCG